MRGFLMRFVFVVLLTALPALIALASIGQARAQDDASSPAGVSLPIIGELQGDGGETGIFQGTASQIVASDEGGPVLAGVLNGLALIGDDTVRVENEPFSSPVAPAVTRAIPAAEYQSMRAGGDAEGTPDAAGASEGTPDAAGAPEGAVGTPAARAPSGGLDATTFQFFQTSSDPGKCDVLYLDLQPITLNLLGLELLTSRITLDVNAVPGEGNLLGNLICSLAGLLDGTPDAIAEITDQLNQILAGAGAAPAGAPTPETTSAASATAAATTIPPATEPAVEPTIEATAAPTIEATAAPTTAPTEPVAAEAATPVG